MFSNASTLHLISEMLKVYRMRNNRTLGIWLSLFALLICMLIWTIEQFEYSREIDFKHFKWPSYIDVKSQVNKASILDNVLFR